MNAPISDTLKKKKLLHALRAYVLVLPLMLAVALLQVKTKYRSGITQAQGYLPHAVVCPMKLPLA